MKRPDLFQRPEEYIAAMEELVQRYRTKSKQHGCALCKAVNPGGYNAKCVKRGCPWVVMTGDGCVVGSNDVTYSRTVKRFFPRWYRIFQLRRWIAAYRKEIERRTA